jgi:hypothetical protein
VLLSTIPCQVRHPSANWPGEKKARANQHPGVFTRAVNGPIYLTNAVTQPRPTRLAQAIVEVGRIDKTIHTLNFIDDASPMGFALSTEGLGGQAETNDGVGPVFPGHERLRAARCGSFNAESGADRNRHPVPHRG